MNLKNRTLCVVTPFHSPVEFVLSPFVSYLDCWCYRYLPDYHKKVTVGYEEVERCSHVEESVIVK